MKRLKKKAGGVWVGVEDIPTSELITDLRINQAALTALNPDFLRRSFTINAISSELERRGIINE